MISGVRPTKGFAQRPRLGSSNTHAPLCQYGLIVCEVSLTGIAPLLLAQQKNPTVVVPAGFATRSSPSRRPTKGGGSSRPIEPIYAVAAPIAYVTLLVLVMPGAVVGTSRRAKLRLEPLRRRVVCVRPTFGMAGSNPPPCH